MPPDVLRLRLALFLLPDAESGASESRGSEADDDCFEK
jgi:hypothetical protein